MKVSILIPVYNERWTLREIVRRVYEQSERLHEVLVVDDGSTDGSRQRLEELAARYARHRCPLRAIYKERNQGKGAAVAEGLSHVTGDVVIIQDADLEYNPRDYPLLLKPLEDGRADVVFGSRFEGSEKKALFFWHMVANKILTLLCNFLSNLNLTDVWVGYKVFRLTVLRQISLRSRGFGFEPEVTIKIARLGCRIYEVPINYEGRGYAEGKKIGIKDALTGIAAMCRAWLESRLGSLPAEGLGWLSHSLSYAQALYREIEGSLGQDVIQIGAGDGRLCRMLLDRDELALAEKNAGLLMQLEQAYRGWEYVRVVSLDLEHPSPAEGLAGHFDTVVCAHVLERIRDDAGAIRVMAQLLKPGGRLILALPAHGRLFGPPDRAFGHLRRYDGRVLAERIASAGLEIETARYLNPLGVPVWWLNSRVLGRSTFSHADYSLYDWCLRLSRCLGRFEPPFGLTILAVARKP